MSSKLTLGVKGQKIEGQIRATIHQCYFYSKPLHELIVLTTKFSIVIGHPRAYFLRNWRTVTWVSNYNVLELDSSDRQLRCARVNQLHLNGFFLCCFPPTFKLIKNILDVLSKKEST